MAGPDLVVKVAANISALQADMTKVSASIKTIETTATQASTNASAAFSHMQTAATQLLGAFGMAFSVGAVVGFGREIFNAADALVKLHDKTDISIQGLQQLQVAGDDAGVTLESMSTAVTMLQKRIGGDDKSAVAALEDLGIQVEAFKQMDGAQMFIAISDAVREIHDPLRLAHDLAGLFGKAWAEQVPVLKRGFDDVKNSAVGMSADTAKAIDAVGDAIKRASRSLTGDAANLFSFLFLGWGKSARDAAEKTADASSAALKLAVAMDETTPAIAAHVKATTELTAEQKAAAEAAKKLADAMEELNSAGVGWKGTLDTIDGTVVEAIKWYLAAGVSQKALAEAYGLTAAQIKAVASARDEDTAAAKVASAEEADRRTKEAAWYAWRQTADDTQNAQLAAKAAKLEAVAAAAAHAKAEMMAMGNTIDIGHAARDPEIMGFLHQGWSLENAMAMKLAKQWGFAAKLYSPTGAPETSPDPSERVPGYAGGVMNAPGGWATVGERGPERMYVPQGANIYSNGSGGGSTHVTNVYVTQPLGTPTAIAAAVDAALMKRARDQGERW